MAKRKPWGAPRFLRRTTNARDVWYYVNRGSVTLFIQSGPTAACTTITRKTLARMLAEVNERHPQ